MASDSCAFTPEHVEVKFKEVLESRLQSVQQLGSQSGLGPPDLCWLAKKQGAGPEVGYYHWVLGLACDCEAPIAAYLAALVGSLEKAPDANAGSWLFPRWQPGWRINSGVYCCYNALARMDIICELRLPGGLKVVAVDAEGNRHEKLSQEVWHGASVSAILRSLTITPQHLAGFCVRRMTALPSVRDELQFLHLLKKLNDNARMLGPADWWGDDVFATGLDTSPDSGEGRLYALAGYLVDYFNRRQRLAHALDTVLLEMLQKDPTVVLHVATVQRALGRLEAGTETLESIVDAMPHWPPGLVSLGFAILEAGNVARAIELAQAAVDLAPGCVPGWLLLSKAQAAAGDFASALLALNAMPPPVPSEDSAFLVNPPAAARQTQPSFVPLEPDFEEVLRLAEEELEVGDESIGALIAEELVPLHGEGGGLPPLRPGHYGLPMNQRAAVYDLLVFFYDIIGWEQLLQVRSDVFTMAEGDAEEDNGQAGDDGNDADDDSDENAPRSPDGASGSESQFSEPEAEGEYEDNGKASNGFHDRNESPPLYDSFGGYGDRVLPNERKRLPTPVLRSLSLQDTQPSTPPQPQFEQGTEEHWADDNQHEDIVCARWLDQMFQAMYQDLYEYLRWRDQERKNKPKGKQRDSSAESDDVDDDEDDDAPGPSLLPCDWMRRGLLCERLQKLGDAERAYRICVHDGFQLTAYIRLLQLYVNWGWLNEAIAAADEMLAFYETLQPFTKHRRIPTSISRSVFGLIAQKGLKAVREATTEMGNAHPGFDSLFQEAARWRTAGYDR
eukprot:jgi/Chlat1/6790/Chrsp51S06557